MKRLLGFSTSLVLLGCLSACSPIPREGGVLDEGKEGLDSDAGTVDWDSETVCDDQLDDDQDGDVDCDDSDCADDEACID